MRSSQSRHNSKRYSFCSQNSSDSTDRDVAHQQSPCPFLHYVERRRDKVIQDDIEFKDYLAQQDRIVEDFMDVLELKTVAHKNDYYSAGSQGQPGYKEVVSRMGLPCPGFVLGVT